MFFGSLESQQWQLVRHWKAEDVGVNRDTATILTITGSLTRLFERRFGMRLEVRLHDQYIDIVHSDEAGMLNGATGEPALRRQVSLMYRGSVMFDAESVLPLDTLPTDLMQQLQEGKRPLGNLLLDRGLFLARSDLSVVQLNTENTYAGRWARRSVLRSESGTRALVVEVFHPFVWQRIEGASRRY